MREMRREPEVPEERVPVVECLDGPARISSTPIHSVKSGPSRMLVLQDQERLQIWGRVLMCTSLMNNLAKSPKRMMTKVQ